MTILTEPVEDSIYLFDLITDNENSDRHKGSAVYILDKFYNVL